MCQGREYGRLVPVETFSGGISTSGTSIFTSCCGAIERGRPVTFDANVCQSDDRFDWYEAWQDFAAGKISHRF